MRIDHVPMTLALPILLLAFMLASWGCDDDDGLTPPGTVVRVSDSIEQTFPASDSLSLVIDAFVGEVIVRPGPPDSVRVVATRWAETNEELDLIDVEMSASERTVSIHTSTQEQIDNTAVDLEITAPPTLRPSMRVGVGNVDCMCRPWGAVSIDAGVGDLTLRIPDDIGAGIDLTVGVGSIDVAFPIVGNTTNNSVRGTIGDGLDAFITGRTAVGSIHLLRQ